MTRLSEEYPFDINDFHIWLLKWCEKHRYAGISKEILVKQFPDETAFIERIHEGFHFVTLYVRALTDWDVYKKLYWSNQALEDPQKEYLKVLEAFQVFELHIQINDIEKGIVVKYEAPEEIDTFLTKLFLEAHRSLRSKNKSKSKKEEKLKGGRPENEENRWACEQVKEYNRRHEEVFQEWLAKRNEAGREKLTNPRDSFRHVLNKCEEME